MVDLVLFGNLHPFICPCFCPECIISKVFLIRISSQVHSWSCVCVVHLQIPCYMSPFLLLRTTGIKLLYTLGNQQPHKSPFWP